MKWRDKTIAVLALLLLAPGCGQGGNSATGPGALATSVKPSAAQAKFLKSRGNPSAFTVAFFDSGTRRLEAWVYADSTLSVAAFDSGYFVSEKKARGSVRLPDPKLLPQAITPDLTPDGVKRRFGIPDVDTSVKLGTREVRVVRFFARPGSVYKAFAFAENRIVSANVGWAWGTR